MTLRRTSTRPRAGVLVAALACGALALTGCGSDDALSAKAADALQTDVAAVAAELEAGDGAGAVKAIAALRSEVSTQLAAGEISGDRARAVLRAADEVEAEAAAEVKATTDKAAAAKAAADKAAAQKAAQGAAAERAAADQRASESKGKKKNDKDDEDDD